MSHRLLLSQSGQIYLGYASNVVMRTGDSDTELDPLTDIHHLSLAKFLWTPKGEYAAQLFVLYQVKGVKNQDIVVNIQLVFRKFVWTRSYC